MQCDKNVRVRYLLRSRHALSRPPSNTSLFPYAPLAASARWHRTCRLVRHKMRFLLHALALGVLPGCLIPLPLDQENPVDGGQLLMIESTDPPLGTLTSLSRVTPFRFSMRVRSDSPQLAGRLCLQVNETCCTLNPGDPRVTRCLQDATVTPTGDPGRYEVSFLQRVTPCSQELSVSRAYVVPVLATGGFDPSEGFIGVSGYGTVDMNHYWTVLCP